MNDEQKNAGCGDSCSGSCKPLEVPTAHEKEALDALREIKEQVREIKERLNSADSGEKAGEPDADAGLRDRLEQLRREWDRWQERLSVATRERMVLLGHEEPE